MFEFFFFIGGLQLSFLHFHSQLVPAIKASKHSRELPASVANKHITALPEPIINS